MNGRYLLDTNIIIGLFDGDAAIRDRIVEASEVFIPSPTLGELYYGAYRSKQADKNVARIDDPSSEVVSPSGCESSIAATAEIPRSSVTGILA